VLLHGNAILVNTDFSKQHPEAVSGFLRAMSRALKDVFADRAEGIRILKTYEPLAETSVETTRLGNLLDKQIDTVNTRDQGLGVIDMPRLQRNIEVLASGLKFETMPDANTLVNMNFMPAKSVRQITKH
jgi:NitT/TauT family transport system substrate-binding protein